MLRIFLARPTIGSRHDWQGPRLRQLQRDYRGSVELVYHDSPSNVFGYASARNAVAAQFMLSDCPIMWMLDADVVPPPTALDILQHIGYDQASQPIMWHIPMRINLGNELYWSVWNKNDNGFTKPLKELPLRNLDTAVQVTMGCTFFTRGCFETGGPGWWKQEYDEMGAMIGTEEKSFCAGKTVLYDPRLRASHYKCVDLTSVVI